MNNSFEWCKGCKEYDTEQNCCHRFSKAIYSHIIEAYHSGYEDGKDAGYTEGIKEGSLFIEGETGQEYVLPLRNSKSHLTLYQKLKEMEITDEQIVAALKRREEDDSICG